MNRIIIKDCKFEDSFDNVNSIMLIIENKKFFYSFIIDLQLSYSENNTIVLVDEKEKELKNSDYIEVIPSIFNMDINNKRNIKALLRILKSNNKEFLKEYASKINDNLINLGNRLSLESDVAFDTDVDFVDDDLLKLLNINIKQEGDSLLELIYSYMKITYELRNIKIFVFPSLSTYLDENEISLLIRNCNLMGIILINIETKDNDLKCFQHKFIIDNDICSF